MQEPRSEGKQAAPRPANPAESGALVMFEETYVRFAPRLRRVAMGKFGCVYLQDVDSPEKYILMEYSCCQ